MAKFALSLTLQQFAAADCTQDRTGMHAVRMPYAHAALTACLTGNKTQYLAAASASYGKTLKARAYAAAFAAVPAPERFDYKGKLTDEVRAQIAPIADELAERFSAAFLEVFPLEKPAVDADKLAERKAKAEKTRQDASIAYAVSQGYVKGAPAAPLAPDMLGASALVDAVIAALHAGQLSADNVTALRTALKPARKPAPAVNHDDKDGRQADAETAALVASGALSADSIAAKPETAAKPRNHQLVTA